MGMAQANHKKKNKRLVLLDSHAILHRAYHALPDFATSAGVPTGALYGLSMMLISIIKELKPDYIVATYDLPKPTHRHEIYKEYKAGRAKSDEALIAQIQESRRIFETFNIPMYDHEGFEADDMLGTIVEQVKKDKTLDVVIASGDMDTLQLVSGTKVQVYTLKKGIKDTIIYDEDAVQERFGFGPELLPDFKGLRGDPSDNIIGIAGIGEKTATTLITQIGDIDTLYKTIQKSPDALKKIGITERVQKLLVEGEDEARFSKELARIRCDAPITFSLPEKTFTESLDETKIQALFAKLEFRTLFSRLQTALGRGAVEEASASSQSLFTEAPDPKELTETSILLWVLDSTRTEATLEDIMSVTGAKSLSEARGKLEEKLKQEKGSEYVYTQIEKPLIPIMKRMEEYGVRLDISYFKQLSTEYHKKLSSLEKRIWEYAGREFNVNSPKQLGEILFDELGLKQVRQKKTASGTYSTKESELMKIQDVHPIIPLIFEYRELAKLLGTYIDTLPTLADKQARIHAQFALHGTTTGRMASHDPNLQNIPNKTELGRAIRKGFIAEKGFSLLSIDYSQVELRIAAILSRDEKLIAIFKNGEDVHSAVASEVFGVPQSEVTKDMRRKAKVINFGILYGMGVTALQSALGTDRKEAQEFYNNYFERFKTLATYLESVKGEAKRKGYTETLFGRRRYFDGIDSRLPYIRAQAERMAINAPIQGTGADITKIAIRDTDAYIEKEKLRDSMHLILQVHDELVFEIKNDIPKEVIEKLIHIMEEVIPTEKGKGVPILVEASQGETWGDMK